MVPKLTDNLKRLKKRRGEDMDNNIKYKAKILRRKLRITESQEYLSESYPTAFGDLFELPLKKIGKGELFGHIDILKNRERYTALLRCDSLYGKIYIISREVNK